MNWTRNCKGSVNTVNIGILCANYINLKFIDNLIDESNIIDQRVNFAL